MSTGSQGNLTLGPLPWDILTSPGDTQHGTQTASPYGSQYLTPLLPPGTPPQPGNGATPALDPAVWSPIMDFRQACEPFWQVSSWSLSIAVTMTIVQGLSTSVYTGSGSLTLSPVLFTGGNGNVSGPPLYVGANIANRGQLAQCCGVANTGAEILTWNITVDGMAGSPSYLNASAAYFQSLLMTPPDPTSVQVTPAISIPTNLVLGPLGSVALSISNPAGTGFPSILMDVDASAFGWQSHKYSLPVQAIDPNGLLLPTGFALTGSITLRPNALWPN